MEVLAGRVLRVQAKLFEVEGPAPNIDWSGLTANQAGGPAPEYAISRLISPRSRCGRRVRTDVPLHPTPPIPFPVQTCHATSLFRAFL